jgi:hypothetical protein
MSESKMADLETHLVNLFQQLPAPEQASLLSFAEFLLSRSEAVPTRTPVPPPEPVIIPEPQPIPRPEQESVVRAVKRLAQTYPMLDKSKMLTDTSSLVMQHVIQGRDANEVIDELEVVFERYYAQLKEKE